MRVLALIAAVMLRGESEALFVQPAIADTKRQPLLLIGSEPWWSLTYDDIRPHGVDLLALDDGTLLIADYVREPNMRTRTWSGFWVAHLSQAELSAVLRRATEKLANLSGDYEFAPDKSTGPRIDRTSDGFTTHIALRTTVDADWQTVSAYMLSPGEKDRPSDPPARVNMAALVGELETMARQVPASAWKPRYVRLSMDLLVGDHPEALVWPPHWPEVSSTSPPQKISACVPSGPLNPDEVFALLTNYHRYKGFSWQITGVAYMEPGWPELDIGSINRVRNVQGFGCNFASALPSIRFNE